MMAAFIARFPEVTSVHGKIGRADWMHDQVELFRTDGLGSFRDLLVKVGRQPAMLRWLDEQGRAGLDAEELWSTIEARGANACAIVGDAFAKPMLRALEAEPGKWDLSSLQVMISSGDDAYPAGWPL